MTHKLCLLVKNRPQKLVILSVAYIQHHCLNENINWKKWPYLEFGKKSSAHYVINRFPKLSGVDPADFIWKALQRLEQEQEMKYFALLVRFYDSKKMGRDSTMKNILQKIWCKK